MKTKWFVLILGIRLLIAPLSSAQVPDEQHPNKSLTPTEFRALATSCAPEIPLVTLRAVARAESAFHPYALSLNYPRRTAREHGLDSAGLFLARQPRTLDEARAWTHWLADRRRSVSIGLLQINSEEAATLGLTADQLFDPCTNIRAGARLLAAYYRQTSATIGDGQQALLCALSGYNSGSPTIGFRNGYLDAVINDEFGRTSHPDSLSRLSGRSGRHVQDSEGSDLRSADE